jgi:hypothetical protein
MTALEGRVALVPVRRPQSILEAAFRPMTEESGG